MEYIINLSSDEKKLLEAAIFNQICSYEDKFTQEKADQLDNILTKITNLKSI